MTKSWFQRFFQRSFHLLLGALAGSLYFVLDEIMDRTKEIPSVLNFTLTFKTIVDFFLPVIFGVILSETIYLLRQKERLNREISLQNVQYRRDILITTLISEFLHEIRNPIHNLKAALEDNENNEVVKDSLERFDEITRHFKRWASAFDWMDPYEEVRLRPWLENFMEDKMKWKWRDLNIEYKCDAEALSVKMHPLLLEQSLVILLTNACEALSHKRSPKKLSVSARLAATNQKNEIELKISDNGGGFPAQILKQQAYAPAESQQGTGLGLLLLRKMVEQVSGELYLENEQDCAVITLRLPGKNP